MGRMPGRGWWRFRARVVPLALGVVLAAGCGLTTTTPSGDPASPRQDTASRSRPTPRTPADVPGPTPSTTAEAPGVAGSSPQDRLPWGPTRAQWERARRIVAGMTLEQKAGQVIVAGYHGTDAPRDLVRRYHLGGVIVMGDNIRSVDQLRAVNRSL